MAKIDKTGDAGQFYKSLYHMSEDDAERATQNFFRRMGITNKDMEK